MRNNIIYPKEFEEIWQNPVNPTLTRLSSRKECSYKVYLRMSKIVKNLETEIKRLRDERVGKGTMTEKGYIR